ncbi:MAG: KR domain-containing protein, partial [Herpetosiphonaceae bacterium]|nr:KR domain-containing protein [Herpetosiphonaceae bacterium]
AAVRELETCGAHVYLATVDVADQAALTEFVERYHGEGWPAIRGVIHTAGTIEDKLIRQLDEQSLATVMRPKVIGGWALHTIFASLPLDFFVLFSSMGSLLGTPGQGNYASANAFLDGLAAYRHAQGLPATTINWSTWAGLGFAASEGAQRLFKHAPFHSLTAQQALEILRTIISQQLVQTAVMPIKWAMMAGADSGAANLPALLRDLTPPQQSGGAGQGAAVCKTLFEAPAEERLALLQQYLREQLGQVLRMSSDQIGLDQPLGSLGLDSIMGVELRNRLEGGLGLTLSATLVWNYPTIAELSAHLADKLGLIGELVLELATTTAKDSSSLDKALSLMAELSDEDALNALLENN